MEAQDLDVFHSFAQDLINLIPTNVNSDQKREKQQPKTQKEKTLAGGNKKPAPKTNSELRQRLQDHLEGLKGQRASKKDFNSAEKAAREAKKQLKRQSKKAKRKRLLDKQKDGGEVPAAKGNLNKPGQEPPSKKSKSSKSENNDDESGPSKVKSEKSEKVSTENLEFNNTDFVTGHEADAQGGNLFNKNKKKSKLEGKANLQQLKSAEGFKKRLNYLEKNDPEKHKELLAEHSWDKALKHAEGKKVNDDPSKIRKSLNDAKRRKSKSRKTWQDKDEKVHKDMDDRQRKRAANIQDRVDKKKDKKMKSLKKRGRIL